MEDVLRPTQVPRKDSKEDAIKILLQAALAEAPLSPSDSSPGSSKENHSLQANGESDINENEAKQLRAIKKLMAVKGYDSLMAFLES